MVLLICYEKTADFDLDQAIGVVVKAIFALAPRPKCHPLERDHAAQRPRLVKARL
jgi:hypothetical protein